jgi:Domain of unknown function (DUF4476)
MNLKYLFTFLLSILFTTLALAQSNTSFVYVEGSKEMPISVKLDGKVPENLNDEYVVLPSVKPGNHVLSVAITKDNLKTIQTYNINIKANEAAGYKVGYDNEGKVVLSFLDVVLNGKNCNKGFQAAKVQIETTQEGYDIIQENKVVAAGRLKINIANNRGEAKIKASNTETANATQDVSKTKKKNFLQTIENVLGETSKDGTDVRTFTSTTKSKKEPKLSNAVIAEQAISKPIEKKVEAAKPMVSKPNKPVETALISTYTNTTNNSNPIDDAKAKQAELQEQQEKLNLLKIKKQYQDALDVQRNKETDNSISNTKFELEEKIKKAKLEAERLEAERLALELKIREAAAYKLTQDKLKAEADAKLKRETEELLLAQQREQAEAMAKQKGLEEALAIENAKDLALARARAQAEEKARLKAEADSRALAKEKAENEAKIKRENELAFEQEKAKMEELARIKLTEENTRVAKQKAELEEITRKEKEEALAKAKAELDVKARIRAKEQAELLEKKQLELERKIEQEKQDAINTAKREAEERSKAKAAEDARILAAQKAELEAKIEREREEALAKIKAESEERSRKNAEEEARYLAKQKAEIENKIIVQKEDVLAKAKSEAIFEDRIKASQEATNFAQQKADIEAKIKREKDEALKKINDQTDELSKLKEEEQSLILARQKSELEAKIKLQKENAILNAQMESDLKAKKSFEENTISLAQQKAEIEARILKEREDALIKNKNKEEDEIKELIRKNNEAIQKAKQDEKNTIDKINNASAINPFETKAISTKINSSENNTTPTKPKPFINNNNSRSNMELNKYTKGTVSDEELGSLFQKLESKPDEDARIYFIKKYVVKNKLGFSCKDVQQLSESFTTQNGKFEFVKTVFPFILDKENTSMLENIFSFDSFKEKVRMEFGK